MTDPRRSSTLELLRASRDDASVLSLPLPDSIFGFHVQQAIEKLLKALITAHDASYLFTHNLNTLINQLKTLGESIPLEPGDVAKINEFSVDWRYDEPDTVDHAERERYIDLVTGTREQVFARLAVCRPGVDWPALVSAPHPSSTMPQG